MSGSIKDICSGDTDKCRIPSSTNIQDTLALMQANDLNTVAVMNGNQVVGVFSLRDLARRIVSGNVGLATVVVGEWMSEPVFWIADDERYEVAKAIMVAKSVRQLVVLGESDTFGGFITALEVLQADLANARDLVVKLNDDYYAPKYATETPSR